MNGESAPQSSWQRPDAPLGTLIFREGLLSAEQLEDALGESVKRGKRLGQVLVERGLLEEAQVARILARQKGLEFVDLAATPVDPAAMSLITSETAWLTHAVPVALVEGRPLVAIEDPGDEEALKTLTEALGTEPLLAVATRSDLLRVLGATFGESETPQAPAPPMVVASSLQPPPAAEPVPEAAAEPVAPVQSSEVPVLAEPLASDPPVAADAPLAEATGLRVAAAPPGPEPAPVAEEPAAPSDEEPAAPSPDELEPAPDVAAQPVAAEASPVHPAAVAPPVIPVGPVVDGSPTVSEPPAPAAVERPAPPVESSPSAAEPLAAGPPAREVVPVSPLAPPAQAEAPPVAPFVELTAQPAPAPELGAETPVVEIPVAGAHVAEPPAPEPGPDSAVAAPRALEVVPPAPGPEPEPEPAAEPTPLRVAEPEPEPAPEPAPAAQVGEHRVVVKLADGDLIELGTHTTLEDAKQAARAAMREIGSASPEEWPHLAGRFVRPEMIVSVDLV